MLRLASYDIVFQEVPGEVSLALNLSGCPNNCPGCHSPHLRENTGKPLDEILLRSLLIQYGDAVTCVCFMGGDAAPEEVGHMARFVRSITAGRLKTAWYSGRTKIPENLDAGDFDYIKIGPYVERLGGLDSPATNQVFYKVVNGKLENLSRVFQKG